jgi:group I intron endonuclease
MIICKLSDKVYVGQTWNNIYDRLIEHKRCARKCFNLCVKLERAIRKYGEANFLIEKLDDAETQKEADSLEDFYILAGDTIKNGYNIRRGGSHGKHNQETIAKMRAAKLGRKVPFTKNRRKQITKLAKIRRGSLMSKESRKKHSKTIQPLNTDTKKYCPKCKDVKILDEFYKRKTGNYITPHHCCISCESKRNKEKYLRNKNHHQRSK